MGRRRTLIEEAAVAAIALTVISALIDAIFWFRRGFAVAGAGARRVRDLRSGVDPRRRHVAQLDAMTIQRCTIAVAVVLTTEQIDAP